jgi:hypothetical protein
MAHDEDLENLYRVFSMYRRKLKPATMSAADDLDTKKRLKQTPQRELSSDDALAPTAYCDDLRDLCSLKHFLPRMLELGRGPGGVRCSPCSRSCSSPHVWRTWPESERAAIEPFQEVLGLQ